MGATKNTGNKSTRANTSKNVRSPRTNSPNNPNSPKKISDELSKDISAIILITLGILLILAMFNTSSGIFGSVSRELCLSLVGVGAYIIPFILIIEGIFVISKKRNEHLRYGVLMFVIISLLVIQMGTMRYYSDGRSFFQSITLIIDTKTRFHSGVIGYILTFPFYKILGTIGSYCVFTALYVISMLVMFNWSIGKIIYKIKKKIKDGTDYSKDENSSDKKTIPREVEKNKKSKDDKDDILSMFDNADKKRIKPNVFSFKSKEETAELGEAKENEFDEKHIFIEDYVNNTNDVDADSSKDKPINMNKSIKSEELKVEEYKSESDENIYNELKKSLEKKVDYKFPELNLLKEKENKRLDESYKKELVENAKKLSDTLKSFGVDAKVSHINSGPTVTRYELQPSPGVKVSKIVNLSDDIALNLAARAVRIEAPVPGKSVVGIEVPNKTTEMVYLSELISSREFQDSKKKLAVCLGKDITGNNIVADLSAMPHVLIAGSTGSGKSVCINTLIISILYKYSPNEVKLIMIDPKVVELNGYNDIPHLLVPVVTEPKKAAGALNWAVNEMTRRYKLFADNGVKNIGTYNELYEKKLTEDKLPFIVIIVDELADLMMVCPNDVDEYIGRLAQMARAAGMHLVLATQRPSVDVITGVIKANIPSRIAFAVSSQVDSRTILDCGGAEKLLGKGDMLYCPAGESKATRVQGAFISEDEVTRVVDSVKQNNTTAEYKEEVIEHINNVQNNSSNGGSDDYDDDFYNDALKVVVESGQASTSLIQRKLKIGYNRAARIMESLEENGIISEKDGAKPRSILITKEDMRRMTGQDEF